MIRTLLVLVVCSFTFLLSSAQKQNTIWYFGHYAGLDFSSGPPVAIKSSSFSQEEGVASICDVNGRLLFYTDGIGVWGANHLQMPQGFGLLGNSSSTQSALIVPKPGDCSIYYIFTTPAEDTLTPLCYSIVDMKLNAGMGDVTVKNIPLYYPVTERLCATLQSNNRDYWVVTKGFGTKTFLSFSVTAQGVNNTPVVSYEGSSAIDILDALGYMKISSDHSKLCYVSEYGNGVTELFDFDNRTGSVSNPLNLAPYFCYGVEFSPDNSRLYLSTLNAPFQIWQYNLRAGSSLAILNSKTLIFDTPLTPSQPGEPLEYGGAIQLAPNGKIYVNRLQHHFVGCISNPNGLGSLCSYIDSAVGLSDGSCQEGLPNLLSKYSPAQDSVCLSQDSSSAVADCRITLSTKFYPSPVTDFLFINKESTNCQVKLILYNALGQLLTNGITLKDGVNRIWLAYLPSAVYFYALYSQNQVLKTGKILLLK